MAPACQLCGSVMGEGSEKGQWPLPTFLCGRKLSASSCLDARHLSSFPYATGAFKLLRQCWSSEGVILSKSVCGFFKRNRLELLRFLLLTQSPLVFAARSFGDLSSCHWNPGLWGLVWGWDALLLRYPSKIFIHYTWVWDQPIHVSSPPTSLDGCGFFNSVVVRLPFNSIF